MAAPDVDVVMGATHVAQVAGDAVHLPMITIKLDDRALAPAAPLVQVPYLEKAPGCSAGWHTLSAAPECHGCGCWAGLPGPGDLHH